MLQPETGKLAKVAVKTMCGHSRHSISVLPLSLNGAFAWLRTFLSNYPTSSRHAAYFLPNKMCVYTPHLYSHTCPCAAELRRQTRPCQRCRQELVTTYIYCNYEFVCTMGGRGGSWKSKRKSDKDPYAMGGGEGKDRIPICPRHMFSTAPASSLFVTMASSQRAKQTC